MEELLSHMYYTWILENKPDLEVDVMIIKSGLSMWQCPPTNKRSIDILKYMKEFYTIPWHLMLSWK